MGLYQDATKPPPRPSVIRDLLTIPATERPMVATNGAFPGHAQVSDASAAPGAPRKWSGAGQAPTRASKAFR
jgi:hypothetical protein